MDGRRGLHRPVGDERGVALLLTLVVLVLLVALIVEFDYGTKVHLITAGNFRDETKAAYLAKSGITAARAVLKDDAINSKGYDAPSEFWAQPLPSYPVGDGFVSIEITDEAGKIDLNRLADPLNAVRDDTRMMLQRLFVILDLDPNLVEAIKDWVDLDDDSEFNGAEDNYYAGLTPPYTTPHGPMNTISELLLIRGVTPQIYTKIRPYVTTVSVKTPQGNGMININTADLPVLQALDEDISPDFARRIRDGGPYEKLADFFSVTDTVRVCNIASVCRRQIGVASSYFSVKASAKVNDTEKIATALIWRQGKKMTLLSWDIH